MTSRCFAFGCSITKHYWGTWADLIGSNFDEYYNFGKGGSSNTFIMNRFLGADAEINFNPETPHYYFTEFTNKHKKSHNYRVDLYQEIHDNFLKYINK